MTPTPQFLSWDKDSSAALTIAGLHANVATQTEQHWCFFFSPVHLFLRLKKKKSFISPCPRPPETLFHWPASPLVSSAQTRLRCHTLIIVYEAPLFHQTSQKPSGVPSLPVNSLPLRWPVSSSPPRVQTVSQPRYETTPKTHFPPCQSHLFVVSLWPI